jgi:triacylglycerol esterase/lipase EstA (alpha/beta hydrolase family)
MRRRHKTFRGGVTAALATLCLILLPAAAGAAPSPPGANDPTCKPSAAHPYPVVLVHGTFLNQTSWLTLSPQLKSAGYCVFALDYGNDATGEIRQSAVQLGAFVDQVLSETHAQKVAIVGHSQGGMMPRYWMKFLGGAAKTSELIGLAPSNHGTTNPLAVPLGAVCESCLEQAAGSSFLAQLNAGADTLPGISYTVISTRYDEVVTPFGSQALSGLPGQVTNIVLQSRCPLDLVEHVTIQDDRVAAQWVLNALGRSGPADPSFRPRCI